LPVLAEQPHRSTSFPNSVWERTPGRLRFAKRSLRGRRSQTEFGNEERVLYRARAAGLWPAGAGGASAAHGGAVVAAAAPAGGVPRDRRHRLAVARAVRPARADAA